MSTGLILRSIHSQTNGRRSRIAISVPRLFIIAARATRIALQGVAILIGLAGATLTALSFAPLWLTLSMVGGLLALRTVRQHLLVLAGGLVLSVACRWVVDRPPVVVPFELPSRIGQYSARSPDPLGLVSVRTVLRPARAGTVLVFVEANTLPFSGLDPTTLTREAHRVLEAQGIPDRPADKSDPRTAQLLYAALERALAHGQAPEPVECPKGVSAPETFWRMYPAEFSHRCRVATLPDGQYWGQSTAQIPVTARLDIRGGVIRDARFDGPLSPYGRKAASTMRSRMLGRSTVDVDVLSGATQTAYAVRSAANAACERAHASTPPPAAGDVASRYGVP